MSKINIAVQEKLEQVRSSILTMNRVPPTTIEQFKNISENSCNDYGLTLKMIVDFWVQQKTDNLVYDLLNKRINDLEKVVYKPIITEQPVKINHMARQNLRVVERKDGE